jgi:Type II CAAX prenyl endopeptidase Rce1-like
MVRLSTIHTGYIVAFCLILNLAISIIFSTLLFPGISNALKFTSLTEELIAVVFIGPIIETWIIQGYMLQQCFRLSGSNKFAAILLSAIVFGLIHIYPFQTQAIFVFFSGILFAMVYFATETKWKYPLIPVFIAHALYNLIVFCLKHLL